MKRTLTSTPLLLILAMNLPILVRSGCLDVIVLKKKNPDMVTSKPHGFSSTGAPGVHLMAPAHLPLW
jgi:hypothetical protein